MDIDLLRTFVAICDTGSFTAAARQVGRTQSAVSLQVRRLEVSLGRPLFVRGAANVEPTEHGTVLLGHARAILAEVGAALTAFGRGAADGLVVLGLPEDYAPRVLPEVLKGFAELYPDATLDVVLDESRALVKRLAEGSVDLAFVTAGEGPVRGGPVAFSDRLVWVAPADIDLHRRDPLPVAIWDESDSYFLALMEALQAMERRYRVVVVSRSITGLRSAVTSGLAVTVIAASSMVPGMRELTAADGFPELRGLSVLLERAHLRKSPMVDRLAAHLIERLRARAADVRA